MLDKLADPLRLGFMSTFIKWKSLKNLTRFFIAISKIMAIRLKLLFNQLKKLYMIQMHHLDQKNIKWHETELKWIKFL